MGDPDRRFAYRDDRILIDSERVLASSFPMVGLVVSGGQLEILRNLVNYGGRLSTFVETYESSTYLAPEEDDWLTIQAILADLELNLMGDENVLWGYAGQWSERLDEEKDGDGTFVKTSAAVPVGYVYVLQSAFLVNTSGPRGHTYIQVNDGVGLHYLEHSNSLPMYNPLTFNGQVALKEGDTVRFSMQACIDGDDLRLGVLGYKMKIVGA